MFLGKYHVGQEEKREIDKQIISGISRVFVFQDLCHLKGIPFMMSQWEEFTLTFCFNINRVITLAVAFLISNKNAFQ